MSKPNNPRSFAETVSLACWRTAYDNDTHRADLHLDVVFSEGRIGGGMTAEECPVYFRLSLRRAEIRVQRDLLKEIQIVASSVMREPMAIGRLETVDERKRGANARAAGRLGDGKAKFGLEAEAFGGFKVSNRFEMGRDVSQMRVQHRNDDGDWSLNVSPHRDRVLDGQPWEEKTPAMTLRDKKPDRVRGEPPEVTVEIRCRREDLVIEDIEFRDKKWPAWATLPAAKRVVVEQYLKRELIESGFYCGDLSDKFAILVLADAVPEVE